MMDSSNPTSWLVEELYLVSIQNTSNLWHRLIESNYRQKSQSLLYYHYTKAVYMTVVKLLQARAPIICNWPAAVCMAGAVGLEPTNTGSKPAALPVTLRPYMVEDVGFEPLFHIPNVACYRYTTSSLYELRFYEVKTRLFLLYHSTNWVILQKLRKSDLNRWHIHYVHFCCTSL